MKLLWKATWPNDFVSFALARSQVEARSMLRELGDDDVELEPVPHQIRFFVTFHPCYETEACGETGPHWHASYSLSSPGVMSILGVPPAPPPPPAPPSLPPADDGPTCAKCGHARFASVHHPDYEKPNKCLFEATPSAQIEPAPEQSSLGPESHTSE